MPPHSCVLVATGALLAVSLMACSEPARPHPEISKEAAAMDDPLRNLDQHPDVAITIRQGTEFFDDGLITLAIRGDGNVTVEQRRSGQVTHHSAHLPGPRIAELGRILVEHRLAAARTTTLPRQPGDTPLALRLERTGAAPFQADLWYADRYQDRDLDAILKAADAVIHEVTAGALGQPSH